LNTNRLYTSLKQGDIVYNSEYISAEEMVEFDMLCKSIHKNVNEPHKLHRVIKHCERIRSNGPWENLSAGTKAENMKPRRNIVNKAIATGWIVTTKKQRLGHGRKRGDHTIYILSHPSNHVDDIVMSCKYDDKDKLDFYKEILQRSNLKLATNM